MGEERSQKQNKNKTQFNREKFNLTKYNLIQVGLSLLIFGLLTCLVVNKDIFLSVPKAQAAGITTADLTRATDMVNNLAPNVSSNGVGDENNVTLTPDGYLPKPLVAETAVTEEPKPQVMVAVAARRAPIKKTSARVVSKTPRLAQSTTTSGAHYFPYGYCTYFVSQERNIPWSGNAGTWLSGAQSAGFATGSTPQAGAIIVTGESSVGHVGMVEAVNGDQVTIKEMNYSGFGVVSERTVSSSYGAIKGYIY